MSGNRVLRNRINLIENKKNGSITGKKTKQSDDVFDKPDTNMQTYIKKTPQYNNSNTEQKVNSLKIDHLDCNAQVKNVTDVYDLNDGHLDDKLKTKTKKRVKPERKFTEIKSIEKINNNDTYAEASTPCNLNTNKNTMKNKSIHNLKTVIKNCSPIQKQDHLDKFLEKKIFDENVIVHTSGEDWLFSEEPIKKFKGSKKKKTKKVAQSNQNDSKQLKNLQKEFEDLKNYQLTII